jgi:hypothetical protein
MAGSARRHGTSSVTMPTDYNQNGFFCSAGTNFAKVIAGMAPILVAHTRTSN